MDYSINRVQLQGRAGKDAELKNLQSGIDVCEFSLATTKSFKKKGDEEWTKATTWHDIKAWGKTAVLMSMVRKGDIVTVTGSIEKRSWDDKDGSKQHRTEITADSFGVIMEYPKDQQSQPQNQEEGW